MSRRRFESDSASETRPIPALWPRHKVIGEFGFALKSIHEDPKEREDEANGKEDEEDEHNDESDFLAAFAAIEGIVLSLVGTLGPLFMLAPKEFFNGISDCVHNLEPHILVALIETPAGRHDNRGANNGAEETQSSRALKGTAARILIDLEADRHRVILACG